MSDEIEISSILESTKKNLGILKDDKTFDSDIVFFINAQFPILHQLGIGPVEPFKITGYDETWDDFKSQVNADMLRQYIFTSVRLGFDPPTNSFLVDQLNRYRDELVWRLEVAGSSLDEEESNNYATVTKV